MLVRHRFDSRTVQVPTAKLPKFNDASDLYIIQNWSERHAAVGSKLDPSHDNDYLLANLCPLLTVDADNETDSFRTPKKAKTGSSGSSVGGATVRLHGWGGPSPQKHRR